MSRGIEGHPIFNDAIDREHFVSLLSAEIKRNGYECYAWVLMKNHYHLLERACGSDTPAELRISGCSGCFAAF